jgi:hypothetical protein
VKLFGIAWDDSSSTSLAYALNEEKIQSWSVDVDLSACMSVYEDAQEKNSVNMQRGAK